MHSIFVILFVSVATLRHHPVWASGVEKVLLIFVIIFVSVATSRHHPRFGVRRKESETFLCNSICVSCYFTPPSPFGRQA